MSAHSYAGLSDSQFEAFVRLYRELCSRSWRVYVPLFMAYLGQFVLYSTLFQALIGRPLKPVAFVMAGVPLYAYLVITFCKLPPPVRPHTIRQLMLVQISWYVANSIILVSAGAAGLISTYSLGRGLTVAVWACAFAGWFCIPTLVRYRWLLSQGQAHER